MTKELRKLALLSATAWLVVAGSGVDQAMAESDDGWRTGYMVFTLALLFGGLATVALVAVASRNSARAWLRMVGLILAGLGCAVAGLAAWALPVWMTLLGTGFALVGLASGTSCRRMLAVLAAAQVVAIAVLIGGIEAQVGRQDEWGDYPAAGGIALIVVSGLTIAAVSRFRPTVGSPRLRHDAQGEVTVL